MSGAVGGDFAVTSWGWLADGSMRLYRVRSKDGELRGYVALPHPEFGATDALVVAAHGFEYVVPEPEAS